MIDSIYRDIVEILDRQEKAVLIIIVKTCGSVPNKTGAKMLLQLKGKTFGTVGGGIPEATALKVAEKIFTTGEPKLLHMNLSPGKLDSVGSICGGYVSFYLEPINFH